MRLSEYIKKHGDERCADLFGVKARTVASWRRGERFPRPSQANRIIRLTDGAVSFDDIYKKEAA